MEFNYFDDIKENYNAETVSAPDLDAEWNRFTANHNIGIQKGMGVKKGIKFKKVLLYSLAASFLVSIAVLFLLKREVNTIAFTKRETLSNTSNLSALKSNNIRNEDYLNSKEIAQPFQQSLVKENDDNLVPNNSHFKQIKNQNFNSAWNNDLSHAEKLGSNDIVEVNKSESMLSEKKVLSEVQLESSTSTDVDDSIVLVENAIGNEDTIKENTKHGQINNNMEPKNPRLFNLGAELLAATALDSKQTEPFGFQLLAGKRFGKLQINTGLGINYFQNNSQAMYSSSARFEPLSNYKLCYFDTTFALHFNSWHLTIPIEVKGTIKNKLSWYGRVNMHIPMKENYTSIQTVQIVDTSIKMAQPPPYPYYYRNPSTISTVHTGKIALQYQLGISLQFKHWYMNTGISNSLSNAFQKNWENYLINKNYRATTTNTIGRYALNLQIGFKF